MEQSTGVDRPGVTGLMAGTRERNLSALLRALSSGPTSRGKLALATGLSSTTVTQLTGRIIEAGIAAEHTHHPTSESRGKGRPEVPIGYRPRGRLVAGTSIRLRETSCSIFDLTGERIMVATREHDDTDEPEAIVRGAVELTAGVLDHFAVEPLVGLGVTTGGVVDFSTGVVIHQPQFNWHHVELGAPFVELLTLPVLVDTSVRGLAAQRIWGEKMAGATSLTLFIGGVAGAALIVNHRVHRGPGGSAGEVMHLAVHDGPGRWCECGRRDCVAAVVTDDALLHWAIDAGALAPGASWDDLYLPPASAAAAVTALRRQRAGHLGEVLATMIGLLNPDTTELVGRVGDDADIAHCLDTARQRCRALLGGVDPVIEHRPGRTVDWDRASAALVVDDYLHRPLCYEPSLI